MKMKLGRGYGRFWCWQMGPGSVFGTLELIIPRTRLLGLVELVWLLSFTTNFLCVSYPKTCRMPDGSFK